MGRSALGVLLAVAAGSGLFGFGLATALRSPPAAAVPEAGDAPGPRRLREENERLRADLERARAARPEPVPAVPAPAPAPVETREPAPAGPALDLASKVEACVAGLRAACEAGDGKQAGHFRLLLVGFGSASVGPLAAIARDASALAALRVHALAALRDLRSPDLADLVVDLLSTDLPPEVRSAALAAAVAGRENPALARAVRPLARDPGLPAADRRNAVIVLAASSPEEALPILRGMLESEDPAERGGTVQALIASRNRAFLPLLLDIARSPTPPAHLHEILGAIASLKDRPWSALQVTGEPDTVGSGDLGTAWAAKGQEMGEVWIEMDYERAVVPEHVRVRETLCPGAVIRVLGRRADGSFETLWEGAPEPEPAPRWFVPPLLGTALATSTIRLVLDTNRVQGWEEIDAVELVGGGVSQWAKSARASTSYADAQ